MIQSIILNDTMKNLNEELAKYKELYENSERELDEKKKKVISLDEQVIIILFIYFYFYKIDSYLIFVRLHYSLINKHLIILVILKKLIVVVN